MTAREWLESYWHMAEPMVGYMYLETGADVYAAARDRLVRWSQGERTDEESERVIEKAGEAIVIALYELPDFEGQPGWAIAQLERIMRPIDEKDG